MDHTVAKDPFDFLMNAGHSPELLLFVGGPVAVLAVIILIYAIVVRLRNRRESEMFRHEIEQESLPPSKTTIATPREPEREKVSQHEAQIKAPQAAARPAEVEGILRMDRDSWLARLKQGLARTREQVASSLEGLFTGKTRLDATVLEKLREALYRADVGVATADKLVDAVAGRIGRDQAASWEAVSAAMKERALQILAEAQPAPLNKPETGPWVILVVGVNGAGKTTSIGKLGAHFLAQDKQVLFAAGDTFRAAAIEQLVVWGERLGVPVIRHKQGGDPAAVAYDGVKAAMARHMDALLIDTAGRLHAKAELMAELGKINRIIGRDLPGAPHETWLVIDATTGQNAVMQVKAFREVVNVTGLVVTKLDGTAKGGVLLAVADQFKLPVRFIGVGEQAADLREFNPVDYVDSLF